MTLAVKVATRPRLLELRESAFRLADSLEIFLYAVCGKMMTEPTG